MMTNEESERLQEDIRQLSKKTDEQHSEYRDQGIALMTTIISLSTGVLYVTKDMPFFPISLILFVPAILLAIWHEYFDYYVKKYTARSTFSQTMARQETDVSRKLSFLKDCIREFKTATDYFATADAFCDMTIRYFTAAAIIIVGVFLGFGLSS